MGQRPEVQDQPHDQERACFRGGSFLNIQYTYPADGISVAWVTLSQSNITHLLERYEDGDACIQRLCENGILLTVAILDEVAVPDFHSAGRYVQIMLSGGQLRALKPRDEFHEIPPDFRVGSGGVLWAINSQSDAEHYADRPESAGTPPH